MTAIAIARLFLFVRETQNGIQNRGLRVEAIQHWSCGEFGDSWCCELVTLVLDLLFQGTAPIPRQGSCEVVHQLALTNGWITTTPAEGDLFLRIHPDTGLAHHIGFVIAVNADGSVHTIAGNTSEDGTSSNGDRVAEHTLTPAAGTIVYVAYPRNWHPRSSVPHVPYDHPPLALEHAP